MHLKKERQHPRCRPIVYYWKVEKLDRYTSAEVFILSFWEVLILKKKKKVCQGNGNVCETLSV